MFTAQDYKNRRSNLKQVMECDLICLVANGLVQKSADTVFPFRQDSHVLYVSGIAIPDVCVVIQKNGEDFIILPKRLKHRDQWEGVIDTAELTQKSGIELVYEFNEGWQRLQSVIASSQRVGSILPKRSYEPNYGMYINPAKLVFMRRIRRIASGKLSDERRILAQLRSVKSTTEIQAIQDAINITGVALQHIKSNLFAYTNERQIENELSALFMSAGAEGHAYDPIIAVGNNATTIHYEDNSDPIGKDQLLLLDVGAQVNGYAADISRTWSVGTPTSRQKDVFSAVMNVQRAAFELLKPGVLLKDYEASVRQVMAKELVALGLIKEAKPKLSVQYYPHLTTHFLGLDVHDAGLYDVPLKENVVLTVEPGIYIPEEGIGVRIEDDVVVTHNGIRNLSASISNTLL